MSNPLIRPGDPRFQRPPLRDQAGNNLFADPDAPVPAEPADGEPIAPHAAHSDNLFAPPAAAVGDGPVYHPQYATTHAHRGTLLMVLATFGLIGDAALLLVFAGVAIGLAGLAAIVPAGTAFILARSDLAAIRQGAIDPAGRGPTLVALWLGLAGVVLYLAMMAMGVAFIGLIVRQFVQNG